jgi:glucuronoarabinoxylan endo-1,4-beta-xylanase
MKKSMVPFLVLLCVIGAVRALSWDRMQAQADHRATFLVHPETTYQTMVGFGSGFNEGSLVDINAIQNPTDRAHAYDLLYDGQIPGANLNIIRLTISPNAKPLLTIAGRGLRYNWGADQGTQAVWQAIQPVIKKSKPNQPMLRKNRLILYAVPFTPPVQWKTNHQLTQGGSLLPAHYQDYAEYLADFLDYYHKVLHVDVNVLSLQNEPGVAAPWDSCLWTGAQLRDFLKVVVPRIHARGLNPKLMLSEGTNWNGAWVHLQPTLQDAAALPLLNIMASHSYGNSQDNTSRPIFAAASIKNNRPVWMSEMSLIGPPEDAGMSAAMSIAEYMYLDLVEGRASAWIYCFAVFRPYTHMINGSLSVLSVATNGALVVPKRFWAMANYSHFVRPGWKRMQIVGSRLANTGFVSPAGNGFAIVVLNASAQPKPVAYDFGNWTITGEIKAYRTDQHNDLSMVTSPLKESPHQFSTTLPPMSVTTFAGVLAQPKLLPRGVSDNTR